MEKSHKKTEALIEPKARTNVKATILIIGIMAIMIFAIAYTFSRM